MSDVKKEILKQFLERIDFPADHIQDLKTALYESYERSKKSMLESMSYTNAMDQFIAVLEDISLNHRRNMCKYCKENCDDTYKKDPDENTSACSSFVMNNECIALRTESKEKKFHCRYFIVPRTWYNVNSSSNNEPNDITSSENKILYEKAKNEHELIRDFNVYSSKRFDKNNTTIGEWLSLDPDGHEIVFVEKGYTEQGFVFKDRNAFMSKSDRICYISEMDQSYTYKDFLDIAENNKEIAEYLFYMVDWQNPSSLLYEDMETGDIIKCKYCNKLYLAHPHNHICPNCKRQANKE